MAGVFVSEKERINPLNTSFDQELGQPTSKASSMRRLRSSDALAWAYWWYWRSDEESRAGGMIPAVRNTGSSVMMATADRRLFVTSQGYIGLGSPEIEVGDHVAILLGGATPFVIRYRSTEEVVKEADAREYILIGDAYVHGLMDGEGIQGNQGSKDEVIRLY